MKNKIHELQSFVEQQQQQINTKVDFNSGDIGNEGTKETKYLKNNDDHEINILKNKIHYQKSIIDLWKPIVAKTGFHYDSSCTESD